MIILGINAYHGDASACVFVNNELVAAAEEERFTRIKHSAGFPYNSIKFCLDFCKIKFSDVDHIAINRNPKQKIISKLIYASKNIFNIKFLSNRVTNLKKINSLKEELEKNFNESCNANLHQIDHHTSHIASSIYFSSYDNTNFISVDGFGDFTSTVIGFFDGDKINKLDEVLFPHSLGLFYTAITQYLGFLKYGDEYKVMGLAPYGEPIYFNKIKNILINKENGLFNLNLKYFHHHTGNVEMTWLTGEPKIGKVYSKELVNLLGPERNPKDRIEKIHMDIASSAQKLYEETLFDMLNKLYEKNNNDSLCVSGGCGMNSVANGKIIKNTKYKKIYIPPSPGDSGGAIGAASFFINKKYKISNKYADNPYLGPEYDSENIKQLLIKNNKEIEDKNINIKKFDNIDSLLSVTAKLIAEGNIIGFFQGRMEWGPRALGNRSILADPRNSNIREILNVKIKKREEFRPFAPSIIKEKVSEWFEINDDVPFMSKVFQIKNMKRKLIPAVTHVDGSGRLQTVTKELNENYYKLINYFYRITGIPMLLNTSFNENEPIVCDPSQALDCFLRTKMDYLIMQDYLLGRENF
tara:strand:- start:141 stop:1886 length:1746 start_codon:yes stop_codon:yes gene_type:complete